MSDLVERLREYSLSPTVQAEAADEIERLQARCAELETALLHESTVKGRVAELEKDAARLKQELSECHQNR